MRSEEARIGEAVASLTTRLTNLGAPEPAALAHDIVHELIREGWRPRAPRYEPPTGHPTLATDEQRRARAEEARRALHGGNA